MSEQETALAEAKATVQDVLDLKSLSLIGLIDGHLGAAALLRSERGQIARVAAGESVFGVTIAAIGDDRVQMTDRSGRTKSLFLLHV
ncbi:hypothetical protein [Yoonia sp.]|uniref:hypothetical protein n=1 Tax=Yoonia sp. TaxID=2212373 RepID=UPI0023B6DFB0